MKKLIWVFVLSLLVVFSMAIEAAELNDALESYEEGIFWMYKENSFDAIQYFQDAIEILENLPDTEEKFILIGKTYYELGTLLELQDSLDEAEEAFDAGEYQMEEALEIYPESSNIYLYLANNKLRLFRYRGNFWAMLNAHKTQRYLKKALELDSTNVEAYIGLGSYYVNAPGIIGGSTSKAIDFLKKAESSNDTHVKFLVNMWLGIAHGKRDEKDLSKKYFELALKIYPKSTWAKNNMKKYL